MTLDTAILHIEDVISHMEQCDCRNEHIQIEKWLRELQMRRKCDEYIADEAARINRME